MSFFRPNRYPGKLIVFEGIAGSGKTTQLDLLLPWLRSLNRNAMSSEWRTVPSEPFTPASLSLRRAAAFSDSLKTIGPALKRGTVVGSHEYSFGGCATDVIRGMSQRWVRNLYSIGWKPSITIYLRTPVETAIRRKRYFDPIESGMDLGLSTRIEESFRLFQGRVAAEYDAMAREFEFQIIDGRAPIRDQQLEIRRAVSRLFGQGGTGRAAAASQLP